MRVYLGIQFKEGITMPFDEFEKLHSQLYVFDKFQEKEKAKHLKEAYKIATAGNIKEDGELSTTSGKSKKADKE